MEILQVICVLQNNACPDNCLLSCDRPALGGGSTCPICNTRPVMIYPCCCVYRCFLSFSCWVVVCSIGVLCSFIDLSVTLGSLPRFSCCDNAALHLAIPATLERPCSQFFWVYTWVKLLQPVVILCLFVEDPQCFFHSSRTILCLYQQCTGFPAPLHPHQHSPFSAFLTINHPNGREVLPHCFTLRDQT